jgi:hypothetical protein
MGRILVLSLGESGIFPRGSGHGPLTVPLWGTRHVGGWTAWQSRHCWGDSSVKHHCVVDSSSSNVKDFILPITTLAIGVASTRFFRAAAVGTLALSCHRCSKGILTKQCLGVVHRRQQRGEIALGARHYVCGKRWIRLAPRRPQGRGSCSSQLFRYIVEPSLRSTTTRSHAVYGQTIAKQQLRPRQGRVSGSQWAAHLSRRRRDEAHGNKSCALEPKAAVPREPSFRAAAAVFVAPLARRPAAACCCHARRPATRVGGVRSFTAKALGSPA